MWGLRKPAACSRVGSWGLQNPAPWFQSRACDEGRRKTCGARGPHRPWVLFDECADVIWGRGRGLENSVGPLPVVCVLRCGARACPPARLHKSGICLPVGPPRAWHMWAPCGTRGTTCTRSLCLPARWCVCPLHWCTVFLRAARPYYYYRVNHNVYLFKPAASSL